MHVCDNDEVMIHVQIGCVFQRGEAQDPKVPGDLAQDAPLMCPPLPPPAHKLGTVFFRPFERRDDGAICNITGSVSI